MSSEAVATSAPANEGSRTLQLLAAYLAATALPVLRYAIGAGGPRGAVTASIHMTVLAAIAGLLVSRRGRADLVAWLPLVLWPALYVEVPTVIAGLGASFHDISVQAWELAIFGRQPSQTLAAALPNPVISEILHAGYLSYYGLIYLPPALLFARGKTDEFASNVLTVTAVWLACLVAFIAFPVAGPRYLWGSPPGVPDGPFRSLATWLLEVGSSRGTAFPSSHVAVAVAQSMVALRFQRRVGIVASAATILLAVGAVYGGFHYVVDVVAGAMLGALVVRLVETRPAYAKGRGTTAEASE